MTFKLRSWTKQDLSNLVHHANNAEIAKNMTDAFPHPYTEQHGIAFIDFATSVNPIRIFCIEVDGVAAGGIGLHPQQDIHRRNIELGYWLAQRFWGQGIISAVIPHMVEYAFANFDVDRIFARPFGTNIASRRVLEKCGFKLEARFEKTLIKNGDSIDELIFAFRKGDDCQNKP